MTDDERAGPDRIRSIAVHREDVATALEATLRSDRTVVLRVTPPFSGRMRARLHTVGPSESGDSSLEADTAEGPGPIHVDPRDLVDGLPPYPEVDETAAKHPDADVETRRERHAEAVATWRERVRESIVSSITVGDDDGSNEGGDNGDDRDGDALTVDVTVLG
ncbi:hypothetical protein [Halorubrum sp. DTA46]|uniref:hypothetical protein n=1 Tax=Halorubrum sp. DTA46 TaxID=3402162 RepID=UPI003AAA4237